MFEIAVLFGIVGLVIVFVLFGIWRLIFGGQIAKLVVQMFNIAHERDMRVDPEAEIVPSEEQPISDVMKAQAEQFKHTPTLSANQRFDVPQASIPATKSEKKPIYEPPYTENAVTINEGQQTEHQPDNNVIEAHPQPFVEDHVPVVDDPIIGSEDIDPETPSADTLDAHIPDYDSSPYGVRSAEHSPGRRLRDKRYRRNASN